MESQEHHQLKMSASRTLLRAGCAAATTEVRCPIARFRVDVAGYLDPLPRSAQTMAPKRVGDEIQADLQLSRGPVARTAIIECKRSRADFLTDTRSVDELLAERSRLDRVRRTLEDQIVKICEPQLRLSGTRLFAELEDWDFSRSRVRSYRGVLNDLRKVDERLHGESKFWTLWHYRLANWLYLAAPRGLIDPREVPPGWGLLEFEPGIGLKVRVPAPELPGKPEHRQRLLRNIAVAATRERMETSQFVGDKVISASSAEVRNVGIDL